MSSLEVTQQHHSSKCSVDTQPNKDRPRNVLKSKENLLKSKCNKSLKNKLKKYRLRKDGKEDEDIIDVSKTLISSLKIKSPNGPGQKSPFDKTELEQKSPKNYLSKMVRKKNESILTVKESIPAELDNNQILPTVPELETIVSKQANAFTLLMDSRNKIIGGNSPGKDKHLEVTDEIEQIKKKELKVKRTLVLQEMAHKKGFAKNQESDDQIDQCIKRKLEKRADRLKEMITINISKKENKIKPKNSESKAKSNSKNTLKMRKDDKIVKSGKLQLINFLSEDDECSLTENYDCNSKVAPEDDEFLKKLGPSIRKKENMLSYFQKLEKRDPEPKIELNHNNNSENSVIKVKFVTKNKKKKPKVILESDITSVDTACIKPDDELNKINIYNTPTRKRKLEKTTCNTSISKTKDIVQVHDEKLSSRPKRNTKKPIKYSEDALLSSSDEEHIFTPIKKKNVNKKPNCNDQLENIDVIYSKDKVESKPNKSDVKIKKTSNKRDTKVQSKKLVKLAPIFSSKSKLTPSEQMAKEIFLKSGVPEKLKIKNKESTNVVTYNNFYATIHVQQNDNNKYDKNDLTNVIKLEWMKDSDYISTDNDNHDFCAQFINLTSDLNSYRKLALKHKPEELLSFIKKTYSKFPVYRTFHLLKTKSKAETKDFNISELDNSIEIVKHIDNFNNDYPDKLSWNEKYKAMSSKQIIGNFDSVKELKRWLESWNENQMNDKNDDSDLSDFCFSDSDTNSRDPFKYSNNVLIISGKVGTGKTSCVYAVAAELAIKVIEVNASSKRTGKIMLQDLQEATQSHRVNRSNNKKNSSQNSQSSQETKLLSKIEKKHGRPKNTYERKSKLFDVKGPEELNSLRQQSVTSSQESSTTKSSLILIDDADIVFDQDDGFCSAISQLINYSKRPVILITSSLSCPHLQKYISCGKVIKMNPLLPRMLGTWLDIMCLADTSTCSPGFGCRILDHFRGDIRKTINFLQFYMTSNKHLNEIDDETQETDLKAAIDDENSSMSWADQESEEITKEVDDKEIKTMINMQMLSLDAHNFDPFNIWWNISNHLNCDNLSDENVISTSVSLDYVSNILDNISFTDYIDINAGSSANIATNPWMSFQNPSVLDKENMDAYNVMNDINRDISREIIKISTSLLEHGDNTPKKASCMSRQRKRNKIVSQHNTLSKYLNSSSTLDRRALALDYWSSCRTICRVEKNKTDSNLKRNNRFCHYLKSLNILCKNDYFDDLSEGLT